MKLARRAVLRLAAGAAALPAALADGGRARPSEAAVGAVRPLRLRKDSRPMPIASDMRISTRQPSSGSRRTSSIRSDAASAPSTKGRLAFAATSRWRSAATPPSSAPTGARHLSSRLSPTAPHSVISTSTTLMSGVSPLFRAITYPACSAVAEAERASAGDLIVAIVIAYEVNCRLVDALDITARGWDPPVMSLPALALAAGKLMKLSPEQLTQAVNIAVNDHIPMAQTRVQTLSDWKGLADAEAARNAVFAALLARGGLSGPAPIFEGQSGFFKQVSGPGNVDPDKFAPHDARRSGSIAAP